MSFVVKGGGGGPTNWSDIVIDADKNMLGFGMSNMKQVVAGMIGGDLIAKGLGGVLIRIPAGTANTVLTSAGIGQVPTWAPGGLYLNRYFPVNIYLANPVQTKVTVDKTHAATAALSSAHVEATGDLPASGIKLLTPEVTLPDSEALVVVDHTDAETVPLTQKIDLIQVLEAAVADDGGATTNESAAAKNATVNDMTLLPAVPVANDAYYFGSDYKFDSLTLVVGIAGAGVWTIVWEYYHSDTTWHALADLVDGTNGFTAAAGTKVVSFTKDSANWTSVAVGGLNEFWIRARVSVFTSIVTQPKGTQAWYKVTI